MRIITGKYIVTLYFYWLIGKLFEIHIRDRIMRYNFFFDRITHYSIQNRTGITDSLVRELSVFCSFSEKADKRDWFDFAYLMQHGTPGENGLMQGYLEMLSIPKSSCSAFVSAITFDKFSCKGYLRNVDFVQCADDVFMRKGDDREAFEKEAVSRLGFPMFVKPTDGGSSFGVTKVKRQEDLAEAVRLAFSEGNTILAEKYIKGRELTCAVYPDGKDNIALPVIEILTEHEFFDYDAKYNGASREVCPAEISSELTARIQEASRKIYERLGCSGVVRVDYILAEDGLYFLEVNTIPGMTSASLVPKMVRAAGLDMTSFLTDIIENS